MAKAYASSVIDAPIERVWAHIRDYNGLPSWHPAIKASVIEGGGPASEVGCVRAMTLADGAKIRERLLAFSDAETFYTYAILESPLAVANYVATLRLRPISDGNRTYAEWTAQFDPNPPEKQAEMEDFVGNGVFQGGFNALKAQLGG
jgi:uncharacterized protein YndB with AHSA1/START domain